MLLLPNIERSPCTLTTLLASHDAIANTRFETCSRRQVPLDATKLALLLMTCGYKVRLNGDTVAVYTTFWTPTRIPRAGETVLGYLRQQCSLLQPSALMDPNDERLVSAFVPLCPR
jgi:hypothetical protein